MSERGMAGRTRGALLLVVSGIPLLVGAVLAASCGEAGNNGAASDIPFVHAFETNDYHSLAFSTTEDGTILFGHHNGIQITTDRGKTWSAVSQAGWDAMNLVLDPFSPEIVYAAGHDVLYQSGDGGQTWGEVSSDLPGLDLHAFAASPTEQGRLYAFAVGHGLFVSDAGPATWRPLWPDAPQTTFAILPLADGTLLIAAGEAGLMRSEDGGQTWVESHEGIEADAVFAIRGDPAGQLLYAGTSSGLFTSSDAGASWSPTTLLETEALVVGVNPTDPSEVMVVNSNGQLFHSRDGGATWDN